MQQNFDSGRTGLAQPLAVKPCRDHLGVVDQDRIARPQILRQIGDTAMFDAPVAMDHHQAGAVARHGGPQGNLRLRQFKIEQADIHGGGL